MQFIRPAQVTHMLSVSRSTLWRMVRAGRFPAPVRIGTSSSKAYVLEEVHAWMAACAAQRVGRHVTAGTATENGERRVRLAMNRSGTRN